MRILMTFLLVFPALIVSADHHEAAEETTKTACCVEANCPVLKAEYCACGSCKEGCDCCETETCKCDGCTCQGCVSKDKDSDLHAALVDVTALKKAACCQSGKCALAGTKCGCDQCKSECKCCSKEKCECKTCSCAKCKDPSVGAHAVASVSCGCGSCDKGCGCCTGEKCECKGCTCSGCVEDKKMHTVLVSKTANACCKPGGACAHDHHAENCTCEASASQPLPETPVLDK